MVVGHCIDFIVDKDDIKVNVLGEISSQIIANTGDVLG